MSAPESLPLTMEPESGYYKDPVVVLDFQSLYPSIIIAYNYCFTTCLGKVQNIEKIPLSSQFIELGGVEYFFKVAFPWKLGIFVKWTVGSRSLFTWFILVDLTKVQNSFIRAQEFSAKNGAIEWTSRLKKKHGDCWVWSFTLPLSMKRNLSLRWAVYGLSMSLDAKV